jgi:hypothetical protein
MATFREGMNVFQRLLCAACLFEQDTFKRTVVENDETRTSCQTRFTILETANADCQAQ